MLFGIFQGNFTDGVVDLFDNNLEFEDFDLAVVLVEGYFNVHGFTVLASNSAPDGFFQGVDEQVAVNASVLANLVDGFFSSDMIYLRFSGSRPRASPVKIAFML